MRLTLYAALLVLAGCTTVPKVSYTPSDFTSMLSAVNQARAQARTCPTGNNSTTYNSAPALSWSGLLGEVARQRAEYLQQTGILSHYEGSSSNIAVATRSLQNGYTFLEIRENLAQGASSAEDAVSKWLASPNGHCDTIMAPHLSEMGMVKRGDYLVLVMAQPK